MELKLDEIIVNLKSPDESERCYAVEDLQQIEEAEAVAHLKGALLDKSVRVREAAVFALTNRGGLCVAQSMASLLSSENAPARNAAMEILEELGNPALIALESYLSDASPDVRKFSIDTIGKLLKRMPGTHPSIFTALAERVADVDVNVAGAAAEALGFIKTDETVDFLLKHLVGESQEFWVQCNIIAALARIASQHAVGALLMIDKSKLTEESRIFLEMALNGELQCLNST